MNPVTFCKAFRCVYLFIAVVSIGIIPAAGAQSGDFIAAVTVTGSGEVAQTPDIAEIEAGVTSQAATAAEALKTSNTTMQTLLDHLQSLEIEAKDIQTTAFNLFPVYAPPQNPNAADATPRISAYNVENRVHIRIRSIDRLGEILDSLVTKGANVVHSISFGFADPAALEDKARSAAIADARHKAELYSAAAGVKLGKVIAIQEQSAGMPFPPMPMAKMTIPFLVTGLVTRSVAMKKAPNNAPPESRWMSGLA